MKRLLMISIGIFCLGCLVPVTGQPDSVSGGVRKNSIYFEAFGNGLWGSLNYDRYFLLGQRTAITARLGLSWVEKPFALGEINILRGNLKHHLEGGVGYTAFYEGNAVFLRLGYRFQGTRGLLVRIAPMYCVNQGFFWYGIALGYSF